MSTVIIAAYAGRGLCAEIFEVCLSDHNIILCEDLIEEVKRGLLKKIKVPESIVEGVIDSLKANAEVVVPIRLNPKLCRDPKDLMVLGTAEKTLADVILTNDKDLLVLKKYKQTKILTPIKFWELLREKD